jgi:hypothetical protein
MILLPTSRMGLAWQRVSACYAEFFLFGGSLRVQFLTLR